MDDFVQFTMRMDAKLYEQLKQSAQEHRRSIAKELENIVDVHFNNREQILSDELTADFIEYLRDKKNKIWAAVLNNNNSKV